MKIEQLIFKNINSIKVDGPKSWTVNFTDSELSAEGLFLICGPTGSGKSSILDALSLALYGKTPRQKSCTKKFHEVMTSDAVEASAKVIFSADGRRYSSRWSQWRARRRADGEYQPPEMEFQCLSDENGNPGELFTGTVDVPEKVAEVTGINYDRFIHSMLLAQGEFARFLEARPGDRAAMLEEITGTEVYTEISREVFQRWKDAKIQADNAKTALDELTCLSEDERAAKEQELAGIEAAREEQGRLLEKEQALLKLATDYARAGAAVAEAEDILEKAKTSCNELQGASDALEADSRAAGMDAVLGLLGEAENNRQRQETSLRKLEEDLPRLETQAGEKKLAEQAAENASKAAGQALKDLAGPLAEARLLDDKIQTAGQEKTDADKEYKDAARLLANTEKELEKEKAEREKLEKERTELEKSLSETAAHAALRENLNAHKKDRERLDELKTAQETRSVETQEAEKELTAAAGELEKSQKKTEKARKEAEAAGREAGERRAELAGLLGGFDMAGLRQLDDACRRAGRNFSAWGRAAADLASQVNARLAHEETVMACLARESRLAWELSDTGRKRRNAEDKWRLLDDNLRLQDRIASLEEHRARLEDGRPCPCCGSTVHPWAAEVPAASATREELQRAEKERDDLREQEKRENGELIKVSTRRNAAETALEKLREPERTARDLAQNLLEPARTACAALIAAAQGNLELAREALRLAEEADSAAAVWTPDGAGSDAAVRLGQELENLQARLEDLVSKAVEAQDRIGTAENSQARLENKHTELKGKAESSAQKHTQAEQDAVSKREALRNAQDAYSAAGQAFAETLCQLYGLSAEEAGRPDILEKLGALLSSRISLEERMTAVRENFREAENKINELTALRNNQREAAEKLAQKTADRAAALKAFKTNRVGLLDGRGADEVQAEAERAVEEAVAKSSKAREQRAEAERLAADRKIAIAGAEEQLQKAAEDYDDRLGKAEKKSAELGFDSLESARAARMPEETRARLARETEEAAGSRAKAEAVLGEKKKELSRLEQDGAAVIDAESRQQAVDALNEEIRTLNENAGRLRQTLDDDRNDRTRREKQEQKHQELDKVYQRWDALNGLIGSQDGKKFRVVAQGLNFSKLVKCANVELMGLTDQYVLAQDEEDYMKLKVIDQYMGGRARDVTNLSGGERFLVSLALALGLASFYRDSRAVETMFLDEGFGTLDPQTLDKAMQLLFSLRQRSGSTLIGIISHLTELKDIIRTQINVSRRNSGPTIISGPGCRLTRQDGGRRAS